MATDKEVIVSEKSISIKHNNIGIDEKGNSLGRSWNCNPEQAEKHISTWNNAEYGARKISKGEESAIKDAANEYKKQLKS